MFRYLLLDHLCMHHFFLLITLLALTIYSLLFAQFVLILQIIDQVICFDAINCSFLETLNGIWKFVQLICLFAYHCRHLSSFILYLLSKFLTSLIVRSSLELFLPLLLGNHLFVVDLELDFKKSLFLDCSFCFWI